MFLRLNFVVFLCGAASVFPSGRASPDRTSSATFTTQICACSNEADRHLVQELENIGCNVAAQIFAQVCFSTIQPYSTKCTILAPPDDVLGQILSLVESIEDLINLAECLVIPVDVTLEDIVSVTRILNVHGVVLNVGNYPDQCTVLSGGQIVNPNIPCSVGFIQQLTNFVDCTPLNLFQFLTNKVGSATQLLNELFEASPATCNQLFSNRLTPITFFQPTSSIITILHNGILGITNIVGIEGEVMIQSYCAPGCYTIEDICHMTDITTMDGVCHQITPSPDGSQCCVGNLSCYPRYSPYHKQTLTGNYISQ